MYYLDYMPDLAAAIIRDWLKAAEQSRLAASTKSTRKAKSSQLTRSRRRLRPARGREPAGTISART